MTCIQLWWVHVSTRLSTPANPHPTVLTHAAMHFQWFRQTPFWRELCVLVKSCFGCQDLRASPPLSLNHIPRLLDAASDPTGSPVYNLLASPMSGLCWRWKGSSLVVGVCLCLQCVIHGVPDLCELICTVMIYRGNCIAWPSIELRCIVHPYVFNRILNLGAPLGMSCKSNVCCHWLAKQDHLRRRGFKRYVFDVRAAFCSCAFPQVWCYLSCTRFGLMPL